MPREYVEQRNGGYYVEGTRVSLDSVVYAFLRGESPDGIAESFPALTLEQVYGAVAFYLANRERIDSYLQQGRLSLPVYAKKPAERILNSMPSWMQPASEPLAPGNATALSGGRRLQSESNSWPSVAGNGN